MEKFIIFLGNAFIIKTDNKAIHTYDRTEIKGTIKYIIHNNNNNKKIGKEYTFPWECSYDDISAIKYIFNEFMDDINF